MKFYFHDRGSDIKFLPKLVAVYDAVNVFTISFTWLTKSAIWRFV